MRKRTKDRNEDEVPGEVTWIHAGGWSLKPTPLAVLVCYRRGERQGWEKGRNKRNRAVYTWYSVAYMHTPCTSFALLHFLSWKAAG